MLPVPVDIASTARRSASIAPSQGNAAACGATFRRRITFLAANIQLEHRTPATMTAMTKREFDDDDSARVKRVKVEANGDGKTAAAKNPNPYLAHWNDEKPAVKSEYGSGAGLDSFKRHATTTKQASVVEDGPNSAFTGRPLSSKYFSILKKRRDLPVHQQRYAYHLRLRNQADFAQR